MFVKICGVTNVEDALLAAGLGADAVGLNFVASSQRRITANTAKEIVRRLPPEVLSVGIFRDERKERVVSAANQIGLRVVQLHGHESPEETRWVAERIPNVIRAFSAGSPELKRLNEFGEIQLLLDSPQPGSGKPFDWSRLAGDPPSLPYILAGGLTPDNLGEAVAMLEPWGVDVASGVERSPGVKDPVKMQRFIATARSVAPSDRDEPRDGDQIFGGPFDWEDDN